eukprot:m.253830 g.253830  ORF g.253830 m.253830 type:complete len:208 (-) comp17457_c0_seq1:1136-1759(-)
MSLLRAARHFSSSAATLAQAAKPPIQLFGIEGRYAHALYSAASKKNALETVEKELNKFKTFTETDTKFNNFLNNPVLSRSQKSKTIQQVLEKQKFSGLTVNFFGALAENNRLPNSVDVINAFQKLMAASRGEVAATITSAEALKDKHKKAIEKSLEGFLQKGEKFTLNYKVDESLLGGLVVEMGDRIIDMSVQTQMKKYLKAVSQSL